MNNSKILKGNKPKTEKKMPEIIAVTSGKGGVGKTNISVNLAILLKRLKKKVLLFDADIHLGNIDLFLGLRPKYNISDAVLKNVDISKIIIKGPEDIDVLPASSAVMDMLDNENDIIKKAGELFSKIEPNYDIILVDTGAGISNNVLPFVLGADKVLLTVTKDPASIADAYGMIKVIRKSKCNAPILVAVNMVEEEEEAESLYKKMNLMVNRFLNSHVYYGGAILYDKLISQSIRKQCPVTIEFPQSYATRSFKVITMNLIRLQSTDIKTREPFFSRFVNNSKIDFGVTE